MARQGNEAVMMSRLKKAVELERGSNVDGLRIMCSCPCPIVVLVIMTTTQ